jgi:hypothetical protein
MRRLLRRCRDALLASTLTLMACATRQWAPQPNRYPSTQTAAAIPLEFDRPDPSGDRALTSPSPGDASSEELPGEPPLVPFQCTKQITGKRPNGKLTISFLPGSQSAGSFRIEFRALQPACNYKSEIRLVDGRLGDGFLGRAYVYRCRRSPHSVYAVSCGPYLGSDLNVIVRGNAWGRTIGFRFPWTFHEGMPSISTCQLPFTIYDDGGQPKYLNNDQLTFDLADCRRSAV